MAAQNSAPYNNAIILFPKSAYKKIKTDEKLTTFYNKKTRVKTKFVFKNIMY